MTTIYKATFQRYARSPQDDATIEIVHYYTAKSDAAWTLRNTYSRLADTFHGNDFDGLAALANGRIIAQVTCAPIQVLEQADHL